MITLAILASLVVVPLVMCMLNLSFSMGKIVSQLQAINDKLSGQLEWIKTLDHKVDDHERRLMQIEAAE